MAKALVPKRGRIAYDEFHEADHPRATNGQFGSSGSSSSYKAAGASLKEPNGEHHSTEDDVPLEYEGKHYSFDLAYHHDGHTIRGHIHNVRDGDGYDAFEGLTRVQGYKLSRALTDHASDYVADHAEAETETARQEGLTDEQREAEEAAQNDERVKEEAMKRDEISQAVERVITRGAVPEAGKNKGAAWSQIPELAAYASPSSQAKIRAAFEQRGHAVDEAMRRQDLIALDRASVRRVDEKTGHLHVSLTPISKAAVNGYLGREIPGFQRLGLDANRIYRMWRAPAELAKGADSFNGKPLLFGHNPVSAARHDHDRTVGAVHGVVFKPPFLMAALDVWPSKAIDAIDSGEHEELSSAYDYEPDMTPGTTPDGEKFDGVMRNISGNHVAMVREGRAGHEVRVHDSALTKMKDHFPMPKTAVLSRTADVARGALMAYAKPRLAQDAKIDLQPILKGVTAKNLKGKAPAIAKAFDAAVRPKLGQDADMDQADVQAVVEEVAELMKSESDDIAAAVAEPDPAAAPDPDGSDAPDMDALMSFLGGKLSDEDMAKVKSMCGKGDGDGAEDRKRKGVAVAPSGAQDKDKTPVITKPAMDAAIAQARKDAADDAMKRANAIREAERFVRPYVGEIAIACDSAEAVHRAALDILKVKHDGKHPDALADLVEVHGQAAKAKTEPRRIAQDTAPDGVKYDTKSFPNSQRLK